MADKQNNQPSWADQIRKKSAEQEKKMVAAFEKAATAPKEDQSIQLILAVATASIWAFSWLPEIAAQLAEANQRDREAEIRANSAEAFVAGIQEQLAKQHIVIPGGPVQATPPRGR